MQGEAKPIGAGKLTLRWSYKCDPVGIAPIEGAAAIVGGVAYVGDGKGLLHAIDLSTGKAKWVYTSPDPFETTPLVAAGMVLLGDVGGNFHCVEAATGKRAWLFAAGGSIHSSANLEGDRVVFGTDDADVFCLELATGNKLWSQKSGDRVNGTPAIGGGLAMVSGCDAHLHGMRLTDGSEAINADLGSLCPGSPAIVKDRIVVATDGGRVVCFNGDGSKQLWEFEGVNNEAMVYSSPAISAGLVVVGAGSQSPRARPGHRQARLGLHNPRRCRFIPGDLRRQGLHRKQG